MRFTNINARSINRLGARGLLALTGVACAALISSSASAVPAEPGLQTFSLAPGGATFTAEVIGDEHFDYIKTPDGIIAVQDPASSAYMVAEVVQNATGAKVLVPSSTSLASLITYGGNVSPSTLPLIDDEDLREIWESATPLAAATSVMPIAASASTTRPLLTIMVEFTQPRPIPAGAFTGIFTTSLSHWQQTLYGNAEGSLNHYYTDMSLGKFAFAAAPETQGTSNDGIVRVKLPIEHPNTIKGHLATQEFLKAALVKASQFVDFAAFDTNGNSSVERNELDVLFVVAGYESSNSSKAPAVWAHVLNFDTMPTVDEVLLTSYATIGELQRHKINGVTTELPATIGIIVHELGHLAVGLPDLYKPPTPLGAWCVMAGGSWGRKDGEPKGTTPVAMSAWARVKTGFLPPIVIAPGTPSQVVPIAQTAGTEFLGVDVAPTIYKVETSDPNQYFLIDNRQGEGYDSGLEGLLGLSSVIGGLGIYRIDETLPSSAGRVAMMASNSASPGGISELYNEENGKTFSPYSDPSSDNGDGMFTGVTVEDVTEASPLMAATIRFRAFDCNEITATIAEHEIHGRAHKHIWQNFFLGYLATGSQESLGLSKNTTVTLHVEAPGIWSVGACP